MKKAVDDEVAVGEAELVEAVGEEGNVDAARAGRLQNRGDVRRGGAQELGCLVVERRAEVAHSRETAV